MQLVLDCLYGLLKMCIHFIVHLLDKPMFRYISPKIFLKFGGKVSVLMACELTHFGLHDPRAYAIHANSSCCKMFFSLKDTEIFDKMSSITFISLLIFISAINNCWALNHYGANTYYSFGWF